MILHIKFDRGELSEHVFSLPMLGGNKKPYLTFQCTHRYSFCMVISPTLTPFVYQYFMPICVWGKEFLFLKG